MATTKKITLSEEELVSRLKSQDTLAIRALYDMYSGALLGVISRIVPQ
ncbi:MAG: RNA polymerase subunit sigma-70, partial [Sphingobacteriales bacterium]